jgi:endonuclease YncB( thermonuclease family)
MSKTGGFNITRNLVHTGWALADREQSTRYVVNEAEAKIAKRALWKGTFLPPKQWRAENK